MPDDKIVDVPFKLIDLRVTLDDLAGEARIASDNRLYRGGELVFRKAAHLQQRLMEATQFLVVTLDDMFGTRDLLCPGHRCGPLQLEEIWSCRLYARQVTVI